MLFNRLSITNIYIKAHYVESRSCFLRTSYLAKLHDSDLNFGK